MRYVGTGETLPLFNMFLEENFVCGCTFPPYKVIIKKENVNTGSCKDGHKCIQWVWAQMDDSRHKEKGYQPGICCTKVMHDLRKLCSAELCDTYADMASPQILCQLHVRFALRSIFPWTSGYVIISYLCPGKLALLSVHHSCANCGSLRVSHSDL